MATVNGFGVTLWLSYWRFEASPNFWHLLTVKINRVFPYWFTVALVVFAPAQDSPAWLAGTVE